MPSSYNVGLSLPENASTYVVRSADEELLTELQNGKFCGSSGIVMQIINLK